MTTATLTGTDVRLREAVIRQLDWDPEVDDSAVGVTAKEGVATLTGFIDSYAGKLAAERSVKHVRGVRAVANDLVVRLKVDRTDTDIATEASRFLKMWHGVPESVQVVVHHAHLTLTGRVESLARKALAEKAVRHVRGLKGVMNHIEVAPKAMQRDVRRRIVQALHRHADVDARHINVTVTDEGLILTGTAASWLQREAAERAAGGADGVRHVDNQIMVVPEEPYELDDSAEIC